MKTERIRADCEACILAGGLSSRMGRDKSKLRFGNKTLLSVLRQTAAKTGFPVRVIRRDLVPRCGPLGGIFTTLKTTRAQNVLFLACDMPFISTALLKDLLQVWNGQPQPIFTFGPEGAGFPFLISKSHLPQVEQHLAKKRYSLQHLAKTLAAREFRVQNEEQLINVNTPEE